MNEGQRMYKISYSRATRYCYAWSDLSLAGFDRSECPECGRQIANAHYVSNIPHLLVEGGDIFPDRLWYTGAGERLFLVSEKALELFELNGVTGYDGFQQVEIDLDNLLTRKLLKKEQTVNIPQYYVLNISGQIELDFQQMKIKKKRACNQCGGFEWSRKLPETKFVDMSAWDGSDLCAIRSIPGYRVCTEKVKELVVKNKLKGFSFMECGTGGTK